MTAAQQEPDPTQLGFSKEEAEMLRSLLRCTHVPEFDELARLRTGRVIAEAASGRSRADGDGGLISMDLINQVTLL